MKKGYNKLFKNRCSNAKENDVVQLRIFATEGGELDFEMISVIGKSINGELKIHDVKYIKQPLDDEDDEINWEIDFESLEEEDLDTYYYKKLGTKYDYPEYFL